MRQLALVFLSIAALLVPGAAEAKLPELAGHTVVTGTGSVAILTSIDREVEIDLSNLSAWVPSLKTTGTFAGVSIQEATPGSNEQILGIMKLSPRECEGAECFPLEREWARVEAGRPFPPPSIIFSPGKYWLYVLTDPDERVTARIHLPGLIGKTRLQATVPADASLESKITECSGICHLMGSVTGRLRGEGVVVGGQWQSAFPTEPHLSLKGNHASCFVRGRVDGTAPDECTDEGFSIRGYPTLYESGGTWSFVFRKAEATEIDGHIGAYALFFSYF